MELLFTIMIGFAIWAVVNQMRQGMKADEAWETAAESIDGQFEAGGMVAKPKLSGTVDGYAVRVTTKTRGSNNHRKTYTVYRILYPTLGFHMRLSEQGMFSGVKKLFGGRDVEVGDDAFDENVIVDAEAERKVVAFLTDERRRVVREFLDGRDEAEIRDDELRWVTRKRETSHTALLSALQRGAAVARELGLGLQATREATESWGLPDATARDYVADDVGSDDGRDEGEAGYAIAAEPASEPLVPPSAVVGRDDVPPIRPIDAVLADATAVVPGDPVDSEVAAPTPPEPAIEESEAAESGPVEAPVEAPAEAPVADPPDAEEVAVPDVAGPSVADAVTDLFAPGVSAYDASKCFGERYDGRAVSWSGTVARVDSFSVDLALGNGPGKKVTAVIGQAEQPFGAPKEILAIVRLADGAEPPAVGAAFAFGGTIVKMDRFMRRIYVTPN